MNIPVLLPTKKYIKSYLIHELGEKPLMPPSHLFGSKLYDLLQHNDPGENEKYYSFNTEIKLFISPRVFRHRGSFITAPNALIFNNFIEAYLKSHYRFCMDFYISINPNFMANLPAVRELMGIDINSWDDDSIKKDYYRYRKRTGKPLLYKSEFSGTRASTFIRGL